MACMLWLAIVEPLQAAKFLLSPSSEHNFYYAMVAFALAILSQLEPSSVGKTAAIINTL